MHAFLLDLDVISDYSVGMYWLLSLSAGPYFEKTNGMGIRRTLTKPRIDVAHPVPTPSYICTAKSGNANAARYRMNVLDDDADAPYCEP